MPHTKINSKQMKDLTMRPETVKLLQENSGKASRHRFGNDFLVVTPRAQATKATIDK